MTNQTWLNICQFAILTGAIIVAIGGWGTAVYRQKIDREKERRAATSGVIAPKRDVILDAGADIWPRIELGVDSGAILVYAGPSGSPIFKFIGDDAITIEKESGVVKLSATIRDKTGTIVAQLVRNEWKINPNASWDRNYSSDAVEVMNSSGDVVLQVRALPDRVQFSAKVYDANGQAFGFGAAQPGNRGGGGIMTFNHDFPIPPIFRYPSATHLGELVP